MSLILQVIWCIWYTELRRNSRSDYILGQRPKQGTFCDILYYRSRSGPHKTPLCSCCHGTPGTTTTYPVGQWYVCAQAGTAGNVVFGMCAPCAKATNTEPGTASRCRRLPETTLLCSGSNHPPDQAGTPSNRPEWNKKMNKLTLPPYSIMFTMWTWYPST